MEIEIPRKPSDTEVHIDPTPYLKSKVPQKIEDVGLAFRRGSSSRRPRWSLVAWSVMAGLIDLLIVTSFWSFALLGVMLAFRWTGVRLGLQVDGPLMWAMIGQYSGYFLIFRVFAGFTIGEWACGLRLGEPRHRLAEDYSLRVLGRFCIVAGTGFICLPVLSLILGFDVAGRLAGLPLVTQR